MKNELVLIDFYSAIMTAQRYHKGQYNEDGTLFNGGLKGFILGVASILKYHKPRAVLACGDCPPYLRKKLHPEYKSRGNKATDHIYHERFRDEIDTTTEWSKEFLEFVGIPMFEVEGLQSPDTVAFAVDEFHDDFEYIVINTWNWDLYQLFRYPKVVFTLRRNKYYKWSQFSEYHGIDSPEEWMELNALTGTSGGIFGIEGIGQKRGWKIIKDEALFNSYMKDYGEMFETNMKLFEIPYPEFEGEVEIPEPAAPKLNEREFKKWLARFDLEYTEIMREGFSQYTTGKKKLSRR